MYEGLDLTPLRYVRKQFDATNRSSYKVRIAREKRREAAKAKAEAEANAKKKSKKVSLAGPSKPRSPQSTSKEE